MNCRVTQLVQDRSWETLRQNLETLREEARFMADRVAAVKLGTVAKHAQARIARCRDEIMKGSDSTWICMNSPVRIALITCPAFEGGRGVFARDCRSRLKDRIHVSLFRLLTLSSTRHGRGRPGGIGAGSRALSESQRRPA
jgi:hypothetical protein